MHAFVKAVIAFFAGGIGQKVGDATGSIAQIAALAPAVIWLVANKDDRAVTVNFMCDARFTWGEVMFWSAIAFVVISIIKYTRPGNPANRGDPPGA